MDRFERFTLFLRELEETVPATTSEEARLLLETILNGVEDRHSGAPYNPGNWRADGRMYPPGDDFERKSDLPGVRVFRTRGHRVFFASNGAIRIAVINGAVVLDKPGKDGGYCPA